MKTIQYMGSKRELLDFLDSSLRSYGIFNDIGTFFDAFSGSGRVSYYFSDYYNIVSNDKQSFTKVINDAYLCNRREKSFYVPYIEELNNLSLSYYEDTDKFFTLQYGGDYNNGCSVVNNKNKIWLTKNAMKIDMIRHRIDSYELTTVEKNVLILSLILGVNKISNTVGHQNGYLKRWARNTKGDLVLSIPDIRVNEREHINLKGDIFDVIKGVKADFNYFDPPYGTNNENVSVALRYSSFYHLWNTLAENSRPELFGKANKPLFTKGYTEPLEKNRKEHVIPKFKELIELSNSPYLGFSYSNKSLLSKEDFMDIFYETNCKNVKLYKKVHKNNNQSIIAKKNGIFIERENEDDLLTEWFFIVSK